MKRQAILDAGAGAYMYLVFNSYKREFGHVMANNETEAWSKAIACYGDKHVSAIQFDHWFERHTFVNKNGRLVEVSFRDFFYDLI